jgi:alanyl aminopeptidase
LPLKAGSCPAALLPNADGAGYYRVALDEAGWRQLIESASRLKPAEALVLVDSLDAGFRAGIVPAAALPVRHERARRARRLGCRAGRGSSAWTTSRRSSTPAKCRGRDGPARDRRAALSRDSETANDTGSELLHTSLQRFLIVVAKDRAMRAALADQAAKVVGLDGRPDPAAADPAQRETVLTVGVQDRGQALFDKLLAEYSASDDQLFREHASGALARVEDPALVRKTAGRGAGGHVQGHGDHAGAVPPDEPAGHAAKHVRLVPEERGRAHRAGARRLPLLLRAVARGRFCTAARADEWRAFIVAHADALPGYERDLDQATERARLCAALKDARGKDLLAAFASAH